MNLHALTLPSILRKSNGGDEPRTAKLIITIPSLIRYKLTKSTPAYRDDRGANETESDFGLAKKTNKFCRQKRKFLRFPSFCLSHHSQHSQSRFVRRLSHYT